MKISKIELLLSALKVHELQLLEKFISSPYFNSKKDIILIFKFFYTKKKKDKLNFNLGTREEAFHFVYPNTPFDQVKITKLISELVSLVQQFYVNQEIRYDDSLNKKIYINSLSKRNLDHQFIQESNKLISQLEASSVQGANIQLDLHLLQKGLHFHQGKPASKNKLLHLIEVQKKLDIYYLLSKLQIICEATCLQNTFEEQLEIPLEESIKEISLNYESENILFPLYLQNLYNLQNQDDSESLDNLISLFFENLNFVSPNEQFSLFILILNITGMKINSGHSDGIKKQFELYQKGLENKILIRNNRMTPESFTNIIGLATHLNEIKWAENFIKNNSKYLPENVIEACTLFGKGKIAFKQEKFEETLQLLWNCRFDQFAFDIRTKSFIIRTLFEIFNKNQTPEQYDFCIGQIQTIEKYIRRKKDLSKIKANSYLNFIKITKRLLKLTWDNKLTLTEANKLKTRISKYENIVARPWLLQKLDLS